MSLFNNYKESLSHVLGEQQTNFQKDLNIPYAILNLNERRYSGTTTLSIQERSQSLLQFDSNQLIKYFGPNQNSFSNVSIGNHPDFQHLGENQTLKHHCISMFVDIKGSTRLALKYPLEKVRLIKDTLLTLCINVITHFGGHVHRLQGDAVFAQFVRFQKNPNDSVINALNAACVLCQTVSEDLSSAFESYGLDPIKIRVGIDYGNNEEVLWSHYGIANCSELTTTSLHTDLAAKLQNNASVNSIRIGNNLVKAISIKDEYLTIPTYIKNGITIEDKYIIHSSGFTYKQYDFNWKSYLNSFSFYKKGGNGKLEIVNNQYTLKASICDEYNGPETYTYFENNHSILKEKHIKFQLHFNNLPYHKKPFEKITWEANNSGEEARIAEQVQHDFNGEFKDKTYCIAHAGFHGNHYLKCSIIREHSDNIILKFPIYVDDKHYNSESQDLSF